MVCEDKNLNWICQMGFHRNEYILVATLAQHLSHYIMSFDPQGPECESIRVRLRKSSHEFRVVIGQSLEIE